MFLPCLFAKPSATKMSLHLGLVVTYSNCMFSRIPAVSASISMLNPFIENHCFQGKQLIVELRVIKKELSYFLIIPSYLCQI